MCNSGYLQNKAFISFIVPVYNACQTLSLCADSHRSQGLAEDAFEIILVNDGSTDGSEALCEVFPFMFDALMADPSMVAVTAPFLYPSVSGGVYPFFPVLGLSPA